MRFCLVCSYLFETIRINTRTTNQNTASKIEYYGIQSYPRFDSSQWSQTNLIQILLPRRLVFGTLCVVRVRSISTADLKNWTGYKNNTYFKKLLREMHDQRLIELGGDGSTALILPPGDKIASDLIAKRESV